MKVLCWCCLTYCYRGFRSVLQAADAMTKDFVRVNAISTVKESIGAMLAGGQCCCLIVDENDLLEGIMSPSDLQREVLRAVQESVYSAVPVVLEVYFLLLRRIKSLYCNQLKLNVRI